MKNIQIAIRSIFKKGRHNVMKIVSLGVGLAAGLVLIAKVCFEQSYDDFYPDRDRVYQVWAKYQQNGGELKDYPQTSGGIVPAMQRQIPGIETVTRYTGLGDWTFTMTDTKMKYSGRCIIADSCFFDILPRPMLIGNAKEVLSTPMYVLVSDRIAKNIGGDVIGKTFTVDSSPGRTMTIGGVFEEIPENSHARYDVIVSMASAGRFMWEGSPVNMLGNDRYKSYVKLHKGVNPPDLEEQVHTFVNSYFPPEDQQKSGLNIDFSFHELDGLHKASPQVKRMTRILSLLAFALIFTAVMNYVLIVISSIVNRSKEVAVHKCYGASENNIHGMMFGEALVHIVLSLILALLLILAFRGTVEELLATSLDSLFLSGGGLALLGICVLVFFVSGFMPGSLYARIPVASAFRNYRENKRIWKKALLLVQFVATGFLVTMLVFVARQYTFMVNDRPGYAYENLAYCGLAGVDSTSRAKILDEVTRLPGVASATTVFQLPFEPASGNNVFLPGETQELFNIADLYEVGNGYLDMMEIPVIQGRSFTEHIADSREIMVDRRFVEKMKLVAGWTDDVIGRSICITEHSQNGEPFTIRGVYENIRLGGISNQDMRPSVLFYTHKPTRTLQVKFHELTNDNMARLQRKISETFPDRDLNAVSFRSEIMDLYTDSRRFRDSVMIGGLVTLLITLIGLIGYTNDEVSRRRKEIAVRRVNGAALWDILRSFIKDIGYTCIYAVILGGGIAYFVLQKWQEQFSEKVPLSGYIFLGCGVCVLSIIYAVVCLNARKTANDNPVSCLKSE
ncbi:ABC transporter permease [Parabacteroides sp. ZJ-118]|uniref:ABC transporter permease n=1 Tax=Parabacteroides sp. ZJ-118 TaxID=2709398 RepID=UPI0013EB1755|nr:ABC transporter permease [Parabacteroides sp. ZJ-118]